MSIMNNIQTFKEFESNRTYSGTYVSNEIKNITPIEENIPHHFINIIKKHKFIIKQIDIRKLLDTDADFKEYFDSYNIENPRYSDDDLIDFNLDENTLLEPIVIVDNELLDGYNRCTLNILNSNFIQDAYINIGNNGF